MELASWAREHKLATGFLGIGSVLLGIGTTQLVSPSSRPEIVLSTPTAEAEGELVIVDVAGAVEKPGVYRLNSGSRVADALIAAGGLSAEADRGYVARYINQAEILTDAMKLYIPIEGVGLLEQQATSDSVNVNTAGAEELTKLRGIGEQRAQAIVRNRPYRSLEELSTKAKIPASVIEENKTFLAIY